LAVLQKILNAILLFQHPFGKTLGTCLGTLPALPELASLDRYGVKGQHMLSICLALQLQKVNEPFFIASRIADQLGEMDHTSAATMLRAFVNKGRLYLITKGTVQRATRYLFDPDLIKIKDQK
jgi:hypothetical protein